MANKSIAFIPARAGSKRIKRKNTKLFLGLPIISYSIKAARHSALFEKIVVSTDDSEIGELALTLGADEYLIRDATMSDDVISADQVVGEYSRMELSESPDIDVCLIFPTSPGLTAQDLTRSYDLWSKNRHKYLGLAAILEMSPSAFCSMNLTSEGVISPLFPNRFEIPTNQLEKTYSDAGSFYWSLAYNWAHTTYITKSNCLGFTVPGDRFVDINTEDDWQLAEKLFLRNLPN